MTQTLMMKKSFWQKLIETFELQGFRRAQQYLMQNKMYRQTYNELSKLSDKELNDIGINRGEIHSIAMEAYYDNRVMP